MSERSKHNFKFSVPKWLRSLGLFVFVFFLISLFGFLPGVGFLRYYIDGYSINRRAFFVRTGEILWDHPAAVQAGFNEISNNFDATISPDGKFIILTHKFSDDNNELYISYKEDGQWTKPALLGDVNSDYNEQNPDLSYDGKYLYFSSDRPGGKGGYDIWCSAFNGKKWTTPYHVGGSINSKYDDLDPELAPDKNFFFFSSNRPVPGRELPKAADGEKQKEMEPDFNIFRAKKLPDQKLLDISGPPAFTDAEYVVGLNTPYNEGKLTVSGRGDLVYFSSNRPGGKGGYDIYRSHYYQNQFTLPENFGFPVNTIYDEIGPTLSMEGFKIYFCSNRFNRSAVDYRFYETLSRQVISKFDYSILIALLVVFVTVALIYYLLQLLLSNVNMKVITRCLLASVLLHLLLLLLSTTFFIGGKIKEALMEGPEEMTININNLARENISVAIREGIASLPKVTSTLPAVRPQYTPAPSQQQPVNETAQPVTRQAVKANSAVSPVSVTQTLSNAPSSSAPTNPSELTAMMPSLLGSSNIKMEVPGGKGKQATGSSKGKGQSMPTPPKKPVPVKKVQYEVAKVNVSMPLEETAVDAELGDVTQAVNNATKQHNSLTAVSRVTGSADSPAADTLPGVSEDLKAAGGNRSSMSSMGMFMLPIKLNMEIKPKEKPEEDEPELGLLKKDWLLAGNIGYNLSVGERQFYDLKFIKELLRLNNMMAFNPLDGLNLMLIKEKQLKPVGNLIYQKTPSLGIPADSELEIPEDYNP